MNKAVNFVGKYLWVFLYLTLMASVAAAEGWELTTVAEEVPGTRYVESGKYEKAIEVSQGFLTRASSKYAPSYQKVAVLTNLCISHIALYDFDEAEVFCARAAAEKIHRSVTYNNLGVLYGLRGQHALAARHFEIATNADCLGRCSHAESVPRALPRPTARRNLNRAETLVNMHGDGEDDARMGALVEEIGAVAR